MFVGKQESTQSGGDDVQESKDDQERADVYFKRRALSVADPMRTTAPTDPPKPRSTTSSSTSSTSSTQPHKKKQQLTAQPPPPSPEYIQFFQVFVYPVDSVRKEPTSTQLAGMTYGEYDGGSEYTPAKCESFSELVPEDYRFILLKTADRSPSAAPQALISAFGDNNGYGFEYVTHKQLQYVAAWQSSRKRQTLRLYIGLVRRQDPKVIELLSSGEDTAEGVLEKVRSPTNTTRANKKTDVQERSNKKNQERKMASEESEAASEAVNESSEDEDYIEWKKKDEKSWAEERKRKRDEEAEEQARQEENN